MNRKVIAIIVVILVAIGGGITYLLASTSDSLSQQAPSANVIETSVMTTEDSSRKQDETSAQSEQKAATPPAVPGTYVEYNDGVIAATPGTKLLFFHAPWCPQCRELEADIKRMGVPDGITVIQIDYDTHQQLRQKYGVTLQTTVVKVDDNGELIKKFVAYDDPSLEALVKNLL